MKGAHMMKHSGPPPHVQLPPVQPSAVSSHELPQLPQLLSSFCVSRQVPEQHDCEPEHTRPHAPQFATVSVRVQLPLQQVSPPLHARAPAPVPQRHWVPMHVVPAGQLTVQATSQLPAVQERPEVQAMPHMPQCAAFVRVSTQPPPQHVCVPVHAAPAPQRHVPDTQVSPASHAGVHDEPPSRGAPVSGRTFASGTGPVSRGNGASKPTTRASGVPTRPASRPPSPPLAHAPKPDDEITIERTSSGASHVRMGTSTKAGREAKEQG
jgi:hypothetical protein